MEDIKYKIVDFFTNKEVGMEVDSFEAAMPIIHNLEKTTDSRYIPIAIGIPNEEDEEIY